MTVRLTTDLFREMARNSGIGRAEALRRTRLGMMGDDGNPHFAHPAFWAPFVLTGEGGTWDTR